MIAPADLWARIERGDAPVIIDVRSSGEYERGHVPGARHVPFLSLLFGRRRLRLDPSQPVVIYCGHGPRARLAAIGLRRRGFAHITYLAGHMTAWARAALPRETGPPRDVSSSDRTHTPARTARPGTS